MPDRRPRRAVRLMAAALLCATGVLSGGARPTSADDVGNASSSVTAAQNQLNTDNNKKTHLGNVIRPGGFILLRPAGNLPREVVAGLAEIAQTQSMPIHPVQPRQHLRHFPVHCPALLRRFNVTERGIAEHATLDALH